MARSMPANAIQLKARIYSNWLLMVALSYVLIMWGNMWVIICKVLNNNSSTYSPYHKMIVIWSFLTQMNCQMVWMNFANLKLVKEKAEDGVLSQNQWIKGWINKCRECTDMCYWKLSRVLVKCYILLLYIQCNSMQFILSEILSLPNEWRNNTYFAHWIRQFECLLQ